MKYVEIQIYNPDTDKLETAIRCVRQETGVVCTGEDQIILSVIEEGLYNARTKRGVTLKDGDEFLEAVEQAFDNPQTGIATKIIDSDAVPFSA